ncbi:hypothetical protein HAV18_17800 [Burkholderia sp. D-99]|nr:hypothetical protein [Burkholderia sp. D-99]
MLVDVVHDDLGAALRELLRDRMADALRGAGHDGYFVVQRNLHDVSWWCGFCRQRAVAGSLSRGDRLFGTPSREAGRDRVIRSVRFVRGSTGKRVEGGRYSRLLQRRNASRADLKSVIQISGMMQMKMNDERWKKSSRPGMAAWALAIVSNNAGAGDVSRLDDECIMLIR